MNWTSSLGDPRLLEGYEPALLPTTDGVSPPQTDATERNERIKLEFCAAYYHINRLQRALGELRTSHGSDHESHKHALLQQVERYLRVRDELEDRYAPLGVIAEAITREGFTVDLKFTFGDRTVYQRQRTRLCSSAAVLYFGEDDEQSPEGQTTSNVTAVV